jgi:type III secretory pathway component EscR
MQGKPESPDAMDEMNAEQAETEARAKEESDAQEVARQAIEAQKEMLSQHRDATMVNLFVKMQEVMQGMSNPKEIEYDDNGLMVKMGGRPVARDAQGRVVRIG